jgi:hypothetical protein
MATLVAVPAPGAALDCATIAAEAAAAVAIPEDLTGLDEAALERLIAMIMLKLDIAKRLLSEKSDKVELRHVDSDASAIAAAAAAAMAIPDDLIGLDEAALERLIAMIMLKLDIAKRLLSEKSDKVELRHVDSDAIIEERAPKEEDAAATEDVKALLNVDSVEPDSVAITEVRVSEHAPKEEDAPKEEVKALLHVDSMVLNQSRLPEHSPLPFGIKREQLPTIVVLGAAVLLGTALILSRRNR